MTVALLYHDIVPRRDADGVGFPGPLAARYKLQPDEFQAHLDAIGGTGYQVGLIDGHSRPPVALTFDDGGSRSLATADALEERDWRGHFFVTTGRLDTPGFLTREAVGELVRRGHVVGSHSHSHPTYMARLSLQEIELEWRRSWDALAETLGVEPTHASVPGGYLSTAVVEIAAEVGYRVLMTSEPVSEVTTVGELSVVGRYPIWSTTRPLTAAAYAQGRRRARFRLAVAWKLKRIAKTVSPAGYDALRSLGAWSERRR